MGKQIQRLIFAAILSLLSATVASAQDKQPSDSLVRLMKASSVQMEKDDSIALRKTFDATFLHNGTYLVCDTAIWNESTNVINAVGNVKLIQGDAILTSETLDYYVDENVARFRGSLVEMVDKDKNTLRTSSLDYYTKDSIARYDHGAVMKDHDGQIIESKVGSYDNTDRIFRFNTNVNMYTDSIFINTNALRFDAKTDIAYFESLTDFRREDNILSAKSGWYDRRENLFFFNEEVHGMSKEQELWSDTLFFFRSSQNIKLLGNARVLDTVKNVAAVADYIFYEDSLSKVTMKKDPAVRMITKQGEVVDTLYLRADNFEYQTVPFFQIDSSTVADSKSRLEGISSDPVLKYRIKVAEEARKKAEEAKKQLEELKQGKPRKSKSGKKESLPAEDLPDAPEIIGDAVTDTLAAVKDTLAISDSLLVETPQVPDTTKIGFLTALRNIRMFKKDIQMCCDSVHYSDLDSIARIFGSPEIWNEGNRQYTADSIDLQILDSRPYKADLISGAFIVVEEQPGLCYDQIKGEEVIAYFDTTSTLSRFDALGGASAIFFLKEDDAFATVNMVEAKMITAEFEKGEISSVTYFEKPKNNVSPIVQLNEKDKYLTGFKYNIDKRPSGKESITSRNFPEGQRSAFDRHPSAKFSISDKFFPGYIKGIRIEIANRRKKEAEQRQSFSEEPEISSVVDTLLSEIPSDAADSVVAGGLEMVAPQEPVARREVSTEGNEYEPLQSVEAAVAGDKAAEERLQKKLEKQRERDSARQIRIAAKQAKEAKKAEARRQRQQARKDRREAKAAFIAAKQKERELKIYERYKQRYEKRLLRSIEADDVEDDL